MGEGFAFERIDPAAEQEYLGDLERWRGERDGDASARAVDALRGAAESGGDLVEASIAAARSGVTTGEWAGALRDVFGEYRAPTGVSAGAAGGDPEALAAVRVRVEEAARRVGATRLRMLVAKPGLDGHSNAAEQVAVRARDAGMEVVYQGIRLTPEEVARAAVEEDVHVIGLSVLSGAHSVVVPQVLERLRAEGVDPARVPVVVGGVIPDVIEALRSAGGAAIPVVVGGIIPAADVEPLRAAGVAAVYTPKDFDLSRILRDVLGLVAERNGIGAAA